MEIMSEKGQTHDLKEVVNKLTPDSTGKTEKPANIFIHSMMSFEEK